MARFAPDAVESTSGAFGQYGALGRAVAGTLIVVPINLAVLLEQHSGIFLDIFFQFLQGGGTAAGAKVFVNRIGRPERNLDVPFLVPQQVGAINLPLRSQLAWGCLEIDPARSQNLDVQKDGPAGNNPHFAVAFELEIPRERPLGEPVVTLAVVAVGWAVSIDHLPEIMHRGTSDLIRLIPALYQRRGLDMRCRNQADQNGTSKRNHHDDFTRRPAPRQAAWPSGRLLIYLAKMGFDKFWSI